MTILQPPDLISSTLVPPEEITSVVEAPQEFVTVLETGQGMTGPQGPQGPPGSTNASYVTAVPISGHMCVALDSNGAVTYASSDDLSFSGRVTGISEAAAILGASVSVKYSGLIEHNGWSWLPDQLVYLGLNGLLTQTLPPTALFVQVVGKALGPTRLLLNMQPPVTL